MQELSAARHHLTGQVILMTPEDFTAYLKFTQAFYREHQPQGPTESHLAQTLADAAWRMNQISAIQTNLLTLGLLDQRRRSRADQPQAQDALATAAGTADHTRQLATLSLLETRLQRQFHQTLALLRELQAERQARPTSQPQTSHSPARPNSPEPPSPSASPSQHQSCKPPDYPTSDWPQPDTRPSDQSQTRAALAPA